MRGVNNVKVGRICMPLNLDIEISMFEPFRTTNIESRKPTSTLVWKKEMFERRAAILGNLLLLSQPQCGMPRAPRFHGSSAMHAAGVSGE